MLESASTSEITSKTYRLVLHGKLEDTNPHIKHLALFIHEVNG